MKIENKAIKKLVDLKGIITNHDKADILLVWDGFKKASMVELSYMRRPRFSEKNFKEKIKILGKILSDLKLKYRINSNYPKNEKEITRYSFIARDKRTLDRIIKAQNLKNDRKRRSSVGILLGYPASAVKAFSRNNVLEESSLPKRIKLQKEMRFLNFRLSQSWRKELLYVRKKAHMIKKIAPQLYIRVIKNRRF